MPADHVFLVVDDGTALLPALVKRFHAMAWPTVVIRPPDTATGSGDLPAEIPVLTLTEGSEPAIVAALETVRESWGAIAGCTVLCGGEVGPVSEPDGGMDPLAGLGQRERVRLPFLLAKHLGGSLTEAAQRGWGGFYTVTRVDGTLGFAGTADRLSATAGLTGLTKTLRLEWPTVGCRAIDIEPQMAFDDAAAAVVGEIRDPNRSITEVGWQSSNRVTLVAQATAGSKEMADGG